MVFNKEADFEQALIDLLKTKGWEDKVLKDTVKKLLRCTIFFGVVLLAIWF